MFARIRSLRDIFQQFQSALQGIYPEQEAKSLAYWVLEETLGYSKAKIHAQWTDIFPSSLAEQMDFILHELMQHKPIQYVFGKAYFMGMTFKVNEQVLIPRPETEELIEWILERVRREKLNPRRVLDIGTGSGCIAVSLAKMLPDATLTAMDISAGALKVAATNARSNGVMLNCLEQDVLQPSFLSLSDPYDLIVSNPPYIAFSEMPAMRANVLSFEPHTALFVPDSQPLIFYERIAAFAAQNLVTGGSLYFEINEAFGAEVLACMKKAGLSSAELRKDFQGKDRMAFAIKA